jgi:hypothetical protein
VDLALIVQQFQHLDWTPFLLAILVGGAVGLERELHGRPAGVRTHMMVCLSAAIAIQASQSVPTALGESVVGNIVFDPNRLAAGIVTGIGFLGAATVIRSGDIVRGITTGSCVWAVAVLGIVIGQQRYALAIVGAVGMLAVLIGVDWIFRWVRPIVYRRLVVVGSGADLTARSAVPKQDSDPGHRGPHRPGRTNLRDRYLHPLPESPPGPETPHAGRRSGRCFARRVGPDLGLNISRLHGL